MEPYPEKPPMEPYPPATYPQAAYPPAAQAYPQPPAYSQPMVAAPQPAVQQANNVNVQVNQTQSQSVTVSGGSYGSTFVLAVIAIIASVFCGMWTLSCAIPSLILAILANNADGEESGKFNKISKALSSAAFGGIVLEWVCIIIGIIVSVTSTTASVTRVTSTSNFGRPSYFDY